MLALDNSGEKGFHHITECNKTGSCFRKTANRRPLCTVSR
jgi:hypothetical protein